LEGGGFSLRYTTFFSSLFFKGVSSSGLIAEHDWSSHREPFLQGGAMTICFCESG
jgi:hypothetical protein